VVLDPTNSYIVSPDLGADLIRIFSIDKATSALTEITPVKAPAGAGPRHGAFFVARRKTYFLLVCELVNEVITYQVKYTKTGLDFSQISAVNIFGNQPPPAGAAAAEAVISVSLYLLARNHQPSSFITNLSPHFPSLRHVLSSKQPTN
jgi:6-phosphogluconolactonase (cycloisomerase 2 family)